MDPFATSSRLQHRSPLEDVVTRHGASIVNRHGRHMAAHYGSPASEAAVCLSTVGIADRFDRTTLELRGAPTDLERALDGLARLQVRSWHSRLTSRTAIVRCEQPDTAQCVNVLIPVEGTVGIDMSDRYAAIGIIGPRAAQL